MTVKELEKMYECAEIRKIKKFLKGYALVLSTIEESPDGHIEHDYQEIPPSKQTLSNVEYFMSKLKSRYLETMILDKELKEFFVQLYVII